MFKGIITHSYVCTKELYKLRYFEDFLLMCVRDYIPCVCVCVHACVTRSGCQMTRSWSYKQCVPPISFILPSVKATSQAQALCKISKCFHKHWDTQSIQPPNTAFFKAVFFSLLVLWEFHIMYFYHGHSIPNPPRPTIPFSPPHFLLVVSNHQGRSVPLLVC